MNLQAIIDHLKKREQQNRQFKDSFELMSLIHAFAIRYKIDVATFSTVGWESLGNTLMSLDKDGFMDTQEFCKNGKVNKKVSDQKLLDIIKKKYIKKKDLIVINQGFWGMRYIIFYDAETNNNFKITNKENDEREHILKTIHHEHLKH